MIDRTQTCPQRTGLCFYNFKHMSLGFVILTNIIGFFPLFLYLVKKRKLLKEIDFVVPLLWLVAIASFYELVVTLLFRISTKYWFRLYLLLEFCVLFYFFYKLFSGRYKYLFRVFGIGYLLTFLGLLFVWDVWSNLSTDSYLSTFESIFVFTFSFLWFRDLFTNLQLKSLWQSPTFYIISGLILYFTGTLFLFLLSDVIYSNKAIKFEDYWMLNVLFCFVFRLFLIISVWKGQVK